MFNMAKRKKNIFLPSATYLFLGGGSQQRYNVPFGNAFPETY
jgi:hypothetical protein